MQATPLSLSRGDVLFRRGDTVRRMHYVLDGQLVMIRTLESGKELVVQRAGPGDLFAEASLFSDRYHCDAVCDGAVACDTYEKQDILNALADPQVAASILRAYSLQIRDLRTQIEMRNIKRADERLLAFIETLPADGEGWCDPKYSWKDISRTLGLTHEACYRALAALEKSGRIEKADGRYRIA